MKVVVDVDVKKLGVLCDPDDLARLMKQLSELYCAIWSEAVYDPYNVQTQEFALKLLPLIEGANKILKFKK